MLSIGEIAFVTGASRRMLGHWEEAGLIAPASVEESTGYRRYSRTQVGRVRAIAALRAVGFALSDIGDLLDHSHLTEARLVELLRGREQELMTQVSEASARLTEVRRRLSAIQEGRDTIMSTLELGPLPSLRLTAFRTRVGDESDIGEAVVDLPGVVHWRRAPPSPLVRPHRPVTAVSALPADAAPFPSRDFTRFWWGESVSAFGTYVTLLALQSLVVLTLDGTAQDVGWLNSARWLPYLVLGLVVGALVDRHRRRPVMVATDLAQAALLGVIPLAWALDVLTMPFLLVVVACYGAASLVNGAASTSFVPRLVPRDQLQRAHARLDGADAVAQTSGPALGGLLVKLVGPPFAVLVDAVTYLFSAVAVWSLRTVEPTPASVERPRIVEEIKDGVRWVYRTSGLAVLAASTHVWFAANAVVGAVLAPFALLTLGLSPLQFGVAVACAGAGGVLGALTTTAGGRRLGTGGAVVTAHVVTTIGVLVMLVAGLGTDGWTATLVLGAGQACFGFGVGFSNSHEESYRQLLTPDAMLGRTVTTMRSFNRAVIVVVAPLGGLLAVQAGERVALGVAAGVFALAVVMLAVSPFRTARAELMN